MGVDRDDLTARAAGTGERWSEGSGSSRQFRVIGANGPAGSHGGCNTSMSGGQMGRPNDPEIPTWRSREQAATYGDRRPRLMIMVPAAVHRSSAMSSVPVIHA